MWMLKYFQAFICKFQSLNMNCVVFYMRFIAYITFVMRTRTTTTLITKSEGRSYIEERLSNGKMNSKGNIP